MQESLVYKLHHHIAENHPELLVQLEQKKELTRWLMEMAGEVTCMDELIQGLGPSKYNYLLRVFENEFEKNFVNFSETGVLTYEILNIMELCNATFDAFQFSEETESDRFLEYTIVGIIAEYLAETEGNKNVMHGLQSAPKII